MSGTRSDVRSDVRADARADEGVGGIDSDAASYLALLSAQGVAVTGAQSSAIDAFYVTGKDEGWYSELKRMYLPIWAAASPNAICMVSGSSGTFSGTMTHAAGYVNGNGSTGYFSLGTKPAPLGVLPGDAYQFALAKTDLTNSKTAIGCRDSSTNDWRLASENSTALVWSTCMSSSSATLTGSDSDFTGILSHNRKGSGYSLNRRKTSGRSVLDSDSRADAGSTPDENLVALAGSNSGTVFDYTSNHFGSYGVGLGMTDTQDSQFTLALKALWETTTGLSLP